MSANAYTYCCADCGHVFTAPQTTEFSYGQFVMRTEVSDHAAYLDALCDPVFEESSKLVKSYCKNKGITADEMADILHFVFSVTCDNVDGEILRIDLQPKCPACGSRNMGSWHEIFPYQHWQLPEVTHNMWSTLDDNIRYELISRSISDYLKDK